MIIATAGHVDHGKTSLVKNLTGVDTDRLAEEKRRGLSINLGFAYREVDPQTRLGFIDVPGHARFINTMIAGVSGIDLALLVVAADDGVMPQTQEHLDILHLLGVTEIVPVLSRIDKVDDTRLSAMKEELMSFLGNPPVPLFAISNTEGRGIAELECYLDERAKTHRASRPVGHFRLPIDRAFVLKGIGLVVTGTAASGEVAEQDELEVLPQGIPLRVRSLRVQDKAESRGGAGQRCALNISGAVKQEHFHRGDVLAAANAHLPVVTRFDARVKLLNNAPFAVKHLSPVKAYIGSGRYAAKLFLINLPKGQKLAPGGEALAQLLFRTPVSCCRGDRLLLRDDSETVTLGGGMVLDPLAPRSKKANPRRLEILEAMALDSPVEALLQLIDPEGAPDTGPIVELDDFKRSWNLRDEEFDELVKRLPLKCFNEGGHDYGLRKDAWLAASQALLALLDDWQQSHVAEVGIKPAILQQLAQSAIGKKLVRPLLTEQIRLGSLKLTQGLLHREGHMPTIDTEEQQRWRLVVQLLERGGLSLPLVSELVASARMDKTELVKALDQAVRRKEAHKLNANRYALPTQLRQFAEIVLQMDADCEELTVVNFKRRIDAGRKLAIEILEYFDTLRFTRRSGEGRVITSKTLPESLAGQQ